MGQHTLLIQIFRTEGGTGAGEEELQWARAGLGCPTCTAHHTRCCQAESGWGVLARLVETNSQAVWDPGLVKAVTGLKYQVETPTVHSSAVYSCVQGYVCPGLLVLLTDSAGLAAVRAGWERGRLVSPPGYTITRLGLSPPCQVTDGSLNTLA